MLILMWFYLFHMNFRKNCFINSRVLFSNGHMHHGFPMLIEPFENVSENINVDKLNLCENISIQCFAFKKSIRYNAVLRTIAPCYFWTLFDGNF